MINGLDEIFLTKLDVLDDFAKIYVVTEYSFEGASTPVFDPHMESISQMTPILKTFPGWESKTSHLRSYQALPENTKAYLKFIEDYLTIPIKNISVGSHREQTISTAV